MGHGAASWFRDDRPLTSDVVGDRCAAFNVRDVVSSSLLAEVAKCPIESERLRTLEG
jgi:hypothetical protein